MGMKEGGSEEGRVDKADDCLGASPGSSEETGYLRRKATARRLSSPIENRHPVAYICQELCCPLIPSKWRSGNNCAMPQEN